MTTPTATYLYGLLRQAEPPDVDGAPEGVPGASRPRALALGDDLWLISAQVPLAAYGEEAIAGRLDDLDWLSARALAHERTVEHFAERAVSLVPMKLLTLFADEARAEEHVRGDLARLLPVLDRVAGREEWGVRVSYDATKAARSAAGAGAAPASGRDFLLRKKELRDASRRAPDAAREAAGAVFDALAALAAEANRREPAAGDSLLLDAAFLIARERRDDFEAAVERSARGLSELSCELTLTGPWPPYNFSGGA